MSLGSRLLERYSTLFYCCCGWTTCDSDSKEASKAQPDVNNTVFHDHHNIFEILVLYRVHITAGTWARIAKAKIQFLVKGKSKDLAICTLFAAGAGSTPGAATFLSKYLLRGSWSQPAAAQPPAAVTVRPARRHPGTKLEQQSVTTRTVTTAACD